jgi:ABC-type antimicrobial peptide transport system permease subunit
MAQLTRINLISMAGLVLVIGGIIGIGLGGFLYLTANAGLDSLETVYETQGRYMPYDEDGNFTDRGSAEGGAAILSLIEDEWNFNLNRANLDPADPLVNTPDELMVQYGIINYHTLHGTQTVVLAEDVEYDGVLYEADSYDVPVDGRYFSDLDRSHPLEGPVRTQAWNPLAFGLTSTLLNGMNSDYMAGMAHFMSWSIFMGLGFMFALAGALVTLGGLQLARRVEVEEEAIERMAAAIPSTPLVAPSGAAE